MTNDGRNRKKPPEPSQSEILDRKPPFNLEAEMSVLSSMMIATDFGELILADLKGEDFYDDANRALFEAIVSLLEQSRPVDMKVLVDRLKSRGTFERVGGVPYIAKVMAVNASAFNIVHYARIVSKHALRRRSIDAAMKVLQYCYDDQSSGEPEEAVIASTIEEVFDDALQLRRIESKHASEVFPRVGEQIKQRMSGTFRSSNAIKTGLRAVDELTGGLFPQELIVLAARASMGKAQPLDAEVLTPSGFVTIGSLKIGDRIIGVDGEHHSVTGVFPQGTRDVFTVTMTDGSSTECCNEHLWKTQTRTEQSDSSWSVKTLSEIRNTLLDSHSLPIVHSKKRKIQSIEPAGKKECVCISVDAPDRLYLTNDFIPTHNSSYASQIAANLSFAATPVLYVTLEMSDEELAMRQICSWSGVNLHTVRTNKASHADSWVVESVAGDLATCNLTFLDKPGITPREIIAVAKHIKRQTSGPICVIIDYIGLVELGNGKRNELIGKFVEQMKTLARRVDSPVILLSQLNRATENDKDKRPKLSNLRESGSIEEHADVVMLLHRQEYYEPKNPEVKGLADLIIAKNRNGPTGTANLLWNKHTLSFKDVDDSEVDDLKSQSEWDKEQSELPF